MDHEIYAGYQIILVTIIIIIFTDNVDVEHPR